MPGGTTCLSLGMFRKAHHSFLSHSKQGRACSGTLRWLASAPQTKSCSPVSCPPWLTDDKPGPQEDRRQTLSQGVHREPGCEAAGLAPAHPSRVLPEGSSAPRPVSSSPSRAASPTTMSVAVVTAWPRVFSATALYWPPSVAETLGMTSEHTPITSVVYAAGWLARLWSFLNQETWGRGWPCTAQVMQHSLPRGSRWGRRPTRKRGFWLRSGSR